LRIVCGRVHEHANAPHPSWLLRARRQRPRGSAAEQRDELATPHSITSSAWDEAGRHFGRAAEQVQTRAAAISEAWSAEFLSRDVQHQPLPGVSVFCV
jgi:hypothetical protein